MPSAMLTIGHSDRTIDDFLGILTEHRVAFLADVRKMPGSRKHPQFNDDALASSLASAGIGYMMQIAGATFQTDRVMVGIIIIAAAGMALTQVLKMIENRFEMWRVDHRG